jgi:hypothetical protein
MEYNGYAGWIKIRPESHLALKKVHYVGKLGSVKGAPYWLGKDIIEIPYEKVMVTDKEAKKNGACPCRFKMAGPARAAGPGLIYQNIKTGNRREMHTYE